MADESKSRRSSPLATAWNFLPRIELARVLANYRVDFTDKLAGDIAAGIVVAVMLIPQGMAYSTLAGLPPMYGLYSSIFALLLYSPFSTSPQLAVGPVAMMSLLSNAAVSEFEGATCSGGLHAEDPSCARFIDLSQKLAFLTGCVSLVLGLFKAGYLVNFLSHPVLKGFTFAAALIIGSSQLSKVLGFKIKRHEYVYDTWGDVVMGIADGKVHGLTFGLFIENMALFYLLKYIRTYLRTVPSVKANKVAMQIINAFPNALVVVVVNIAIVAGAGLDKEGVGIVGKIDSGIPTPRNLFDENFGSDAGRLFASALIMCIVGFMESISVAKAMALRFGNEVDSNQELVGLGVGNFVGAFFNSFSTTGGFSRTSVNADAGAKTPLAGMISSLILIIVVVFLTGLFEYLPDVTLGSMIIFAVIKLVEFTTPRMLWAVDKGDFVVYIVSLIATIVLGIELGIAVGAAISLVRVIKEAALPHVAVLGRMPGSSGTWRNVKRFPGVAKPVADVHVLRFDSSIFFANAAFFRSLILRASSPKHAECVPRAIVVDCSAIANLDSSAIHMLEGLPAELRKQAKTLKEDRLKELKRRLEKCAPKAMVDEVRSLRTPAGATVDAFNPYAPSDLPCHDTDVADEPDALNERIHHVLESPPRIPVLYLSCMRGPVRDMIKRNDHFEDCDEARARYVDGNFWRCEYPCRMVAPHKLLFVGCRTVPGMPGTAEAKAESAPPARAGAGGDSSLASASVSLEDRVAAASVPPSEQQARRAASRADSSLGGEQDEGPVGSPSHGEKYPLLQLVLQEQDIEEAVAKVEGFLRDMDDVAEKERASSAEAGASKRSGAIATAAAASSAEAMA
ncbi:hypothetical protein FNF31_06091 [Cafeteria roenbergensis]|uniref:STAS domain-containing protein n=1 Tax=Cafeteria roenbergensis TaxID=33653 RepID=A0A5A8CR30_CAFRO|nr:hypothetical protein FNF28_07641 [Cafeteria roenbergensis]KAA0155552.1 hypothetical protein FNF31_06091 [Cafeteria roenbergensis]